MALDNDRKIDTRITIEGPFTKKHLAMFSECPHFDDLFIRANKLVTVKIARNFIPIQSVSKMSIWNGITRAAMRHVISRPNLTELDVFQLKPSGQLEGFKNAESLTYFGCAYGLNENDLLELATCLSLKRLAAHMAKISEKSLASLLGLPFLTELDFEDSNFTDDHAALTAQSKTILKLEVGGTKLTKIGLEKICSMKQLKGLDIWSNDIGVDELELLAALTNLEYLSIGGHDEQTVFTAENTLPLLEKIPSLKNVWLDGLTVRKDDWDYLNDRYDKVRVTSVIE